MEPTDPPRRRRAGRRGRHHRHLPAAPGPRGGLLRRAASRPATASAAPGTGTATPAPGSTPRATPTATSSRRSSSTSGSGRSTSPRQPETERYLNHVVDRFDLRRHIRFGAAVTSAVWDEPSGTWAVTHRRRHRASGPGSSSPPPACCRCRTSPTCPGRDDFRGECSTTPAGGRPSRSTSPASGSPSSAPSSSGVQVVPAIVDEVAVAHRLPAHRQLVHAAQQPPDHRRGAGAAAGRLRGRCARC